MPAKKKSKSKQSSETEHRENKDQLSWWKEAVIYQIYPRSFYDTNGDGIGDIQGIIEKLDYLTDLGVDAVWLSPVYPSPMFDFGYDISDYESIDPVFGDLETFRKLLKESHSRGIKIIMDLVINHTSHLHPWFLESRSSKESRKRDWYIWKDKVEGKEPNNWMAAFGGKAWEWDEKTEQYYYHAFTVEQPDLNWRNPEVKNAVFKMIRFWLDMGVDGFRLDVVNYYIKDEELRNNPRHFFQGFREYERQDHIFDRNRPETHDILKEFRKLLDSYPGDRMSVGEVFYQPPGDPEASASYCGEDDQLHMAFNFSFLYQKWSAGRFAKAIQTWEDVLSRKHGWPNYTLSNHDQKRHISRYASGKETSARAKICACMLLTLRGTPFLYYGEEIGMKSEAVPFKYVQDPLGKRYWPLFPGRDVSRLPMCWDNTRNAGFSKGSPWLPVYSEAETVNVKTMSSDSGSLLWVYKNLIAIRKKEKALRRGTQKLLFLHQDRILAYIREYENEKILVLLNFTSSDRKMALSEEYMLFSSSGKVLFSTHRPKDSSYVADGILSMSPLEATVIKYG